MQQSELESTHDRMVASRLFTRREVEPMDTYKVLTLFILFGMFLIVLLT